MVRFGRRGPDNLVSAREVGRLERKSQFLRTLQAPTTDILTFPRRRRCRVDKKTKKKIETLQKKLQNLRQQLAGAKRQTDEPGEVERLAAEVERCETEMKQLKEN